MSKPTFLDQLLTACENMPIGAFAYAETLDRARRELLELRAALKERDDLRTQYETNERNHTLQVGNMEQEWQRQADNWTNDRSLLLELVANWQERCAVLEKEREQQRARADQVREQERELVTRMAAQVTDEISGDWGDLPAAEAYSKRNAVADFCHKLSVAWEQEDDS